MDLSGVLILISAAFFILLLWIVVGVRHLVTLKKEIRDKWEMVDEKLRKRQDIVPLLIETVRDYTDQQEGLIEDLIVARRLAAKEYNPGEQKIEYEYDLTTYINKMIDLEKNYDDLSKDTIFLGLKKQIDDLENSIEQSSREYNEFVRKYNSSRNFALLRPLAAVFNYKVEDIFEVEE